MFKNQCISRAIGIQGRGDESARKISDPVSTFYKAAGSEALSEFVKKPVEAKQSNRAKPITCLFAQ